MSDGHGRRGDGEVAELGEEEPDLGESVEVDSNSGDIPMAPDRTDGPVREERTG